MPKGNDMTSRIATKWLHDYIRTCATASGAIIAMLASSSPAGAALDNTAKASGTFNATNYDSAPSSVSIPVSGASPGLSVVKTVDLIDVSFGADSTKVDTGDKITFKYVITNNGNVTLKNVTPIDSGPKFNSIPGTASLVGFTLSSGSTQIAPTESVTFTASYTMSATDVYNAAGITDGVSNTATASGLPLAVGATTYTTPTGSTALATLAANPKLQITKTRAFTTDNSPLLSADVGDVIVYTYKVKNIGNVTMTGINVVDNHEGTNLVIPPKNEALTLTGPVGTNADDATANNGIWGTLTPESEVTFTYTHTVTQAEFNAQ